MTKKITDKADYAAVDDIIALGYPKNSRYLDHLLEWTADPNWPIAEAIYRYFIELGVLEQPRVIKLAQQVDVDWRYALIVQLIAQYDDKAIQPCVASLVGWAKEMGSEECDIESLRILTSRKLLPAAQIAQIAHRNLFVYNLWIKETMEAAESAIYALPLRDHHTIP